MPKAYLDYDKQSIAMKKSTYADLMASDLNFQRYDIGLCERDIENSAHEKHLKECIEMCDVIGKGTEEDISILTQMIMTYTHRNKYRWEK